MDHIATIILIRELDKRVYYFDGSDTALSSVSEQTVQSLKESLSEFLKQHTETVLTRFLDKEKA
jgi:hypothetical protein